jgi:hypothetical protein
MVRQFCRALVVASTRSPSMRGLEAELGDVHFASEGAIESEPVRGAELAGPSQLRDLRAAH